MAHIKLLSKYSALLNKLEVQRIVTSILANYKLESIVKQSDNEIVFKYFDNKSEKITLTIFGKDLIFEKDGKDRKEITRIVAGPDDKCNPMINKFICEKRDRGIIITETREYYDWTRFTDKEKLPVDLYEYRYVFGNDNIKAIYDHITPVQFELINKNNINLINYNLANFRTDFEVHMKTYKTNFEGYVFNDSMYPTIVKFNGNDVSCCYDMVDGPDKIKRVHDLYNGIINEDNKEDIKAMHLGLMDTDGFDLRNFTGFEDKENAFLGDPLEPSEEYKRTTKRILKSVIGYEGEIKYDRDSLLNCICYDLSDIEHKEENVEQPKKKVKLLDRIFKKNNK